MDQLARLIQGILDLGAPIVLPIIMMLVGLLFKTGFKTALSSGLLIGVGFTAMNVILDFLFTSIGAASTAFVDNTGLNLTTLDVGWAPVAAISWAWPYAFLMFPLQILLNILMLTLNLTATLNVDLWNVWNKVLTGLLIASISGSIPLAFLFAAIEIILELKQADWSANLVEECTGIPGVAITHPLLLEWVLFLPLNKLLDRIPYIANNAFDPEALREKIGIFAENHVAGFFIGALLAVFAGYNLGGILALGVQAGTALALFPLAAKFFISALMPIADSARDILESRFPGRTFHIGLNWSYAAGLASLWVAAILNIPVLIFWSIVLPGNSVLPFGGILALTSSIPAAIVTRNDVLRTTLLTWISQPLWIFAGNLFSAPITDMARAVNVIEIPADVSSITWITMEAPSMRISFTAVSNLVANGHISPSLAIAALTVVLFFVSSRMLREEDRKSARTLAQLASRE